MNMALHIEKLKKDQIFFTHLWSLKLCNPLYSMNVIMHQDIKHPQDCTISSKDPFTGINCANIAINMKGHVLNVHRSH